MAIVSAGVAPPVVKLVTDALAIHPALVSNRWSDTVTEPSSALRLPPGPVLPRLVVAGTEIDNTPGSRTVRVHRGSEPPAKQLFPSLLDVTVLVRYLSPVSGLLTVTEYVIVAAAPTAKIARPRQVG